MSNNLASPWSGDVFQWMRSMGQFGLINVNLSGSQNPVLEEGILVHWSYGRQLGRLLRTMDVLVEHLDRSTLNKEELQILHDFDSMSNEIKNIRKHHEDN